jgi:hypothetical protein
MVFINERKRERERYLVSFFTSHKSSHPTLIGHTEASSECFSIWLQETETDHHLLIYRLVVSPDTSWGAIEFSPLCSANLVFKPTQKTEIDTDKKLFGIYIIFVCKNLNFVCSALELDRISMQQDLFLPCFRQNIKH